MRIETDPAVCVGSGMCALTLPEHFDQSDEDGTVVVLLPDVPPDKVPLLREAVERCPSGALRIAGEPHAG